MDYNLITPADFASYAPEVVTTGYTAPTISGMIAQASRRVSDYLEYTPIVEVIVDEVKKGIVKSNGDLYIKPAKVPIVSVSAINIFKGSETIALTLLTSTGVKKYNIDFRSRSIVYPYYEFNGSSGTLVLTDFLSLRYSDFYIKLSYTAGWQPDQLPATIKQATVLFMRDIISQANNPLGATSFSQGSISMSFGNARYGSKFIQDAVRLLAPYKRIG